MQSLYLKDVRCFASTRRVPIAPITLLVGENSTGKSSFLALARIAVDLVRGNLTPNFNADPFFLGAYDQIAHFRGGRSGRARSFHIGATVPLPTAGRLRNVPPQGSVRAEFTKRGSQPRVSNFTFECGQYRIGVRPMADEADVFRVRTPNWEGPLLGKGFRRIRQQDEIDFRFFSFVIMQSIDRFSDEFPKDSPPTQDLETLHQIVRATGLYRLSPYAIAPVRTKPERTYNPIDDTPKSEGSHVPMILAKTFFSDKSEWTKIKENIDSFGRASGMFEELNLRPLGKSDSDPFQITVKIAGPPSNLIDVGYGVSQALPIVVDLIMNRRNQIYLLQQPEVHLHPRAQAELGSFISSVASRQNILLVETHSDYIIDRIRTDARDGKSINCDDVLILYFERDGFEVKISPIRIDSDGNLQTAPESYRRFFMQEELRLLGIA